MECENCGRVIGKLESPYVFKDKPVCANCYETLVAETTKPKLIKSKNISVSKEIKLNRTGVLLSGVGMMAVGMGIGTITRSQDDPNEVLVAIAVLLICVGLTALAYWLVLLLKSA